MLSGSTALPAAGRALNLAGSDEVHIVTGVSDGVFAPNASITREQLVVMLYRYAGEPNAGGSLTGFSRTFGKRIPWLLPQR